MITLVNLRRTMCAFASDFNTKCVFATVSMRCGLPSTMKFMKIVIYSENLCLLRTFLILSSHKHDQTFAPVARMHPTCFKFARLRSIWDSLTVIRRKLKFMPLFDAHLCLTQQQIVLFVWDFLSGFNGKLL